MFLSRSLVLVRTNRWLVAIPIRYSDNNFLNNVSSLLDVGEGNIRFIFRHPHMRFVIRYPIALTLLTSVNDNLTCVILSPNESIQYWQFVSVSSYQSSITGLSLPSSNGSFTLRHGFCKDSNNSSCTSKFVCMCIVIFPHFLLFVVALHWVYEKPFALILHYISYIMTGWFNARRVYIYIWNFSVIKSYLNLEIS